MLTTYTPRGVTEALVFCKIAADENQLRTEFSRLAARHASADAEGLGLVGCGENDPATHGDRLAAQGWVQQLLDRRIKCIQIGMENRCLRLHHLTGNPASSP